MRLNTWGSFLLQISLSVCFLSALTEGLVANKVTYEYGAKIPKADLAGAAAEHKPVRRQPIIATEFKSIPVVKPAVKNTRVVRQDITLPPRAKNQRSRGVVLPKPELPPLTHKINQAFVETNPIPAIAPKPFIQQEASPVNIKPIIRRQPLPIVEKPTAKPLKLKKHPLYLAPAQTQDVKPHTKKYKYTKKMLHKPMMFSYTKDQNPAATHDNSAAAADYAVSEEHADHGDDNTGGTGAEENHGHGHGNNHFVKGGGDEHHKGSYHKSGDKGEKEYDGHHDFEKEEKGHHDKEGHRGKYLDESGHKKSHHFTDGEYADHHKGEKGEKAADYAEKGKYSKGHSTKGEHNVHKLDEYEKKNVFFDEDHDEGDDEKFGAFYEESDYKKGSSEKSGHKKSGHHKDGYGKHGHHEKGGHYKENKGHDEEDDHDKYHKHHTEYKKKDGANEAKKWGHKKEAGDHGHGGGGDGGHHWSIGGDGGHHFWADRSDAGDHGYDGGDDHGYNGGDDHYEEDDGGSYEGGDDGGSSHDGDDGSHEEDGGDGDDGGNQEDGGHEGDSGHHWSDGSNGGDNGGHASNHWTNRVTDGNAVSKPHVVSHVPPPVVSAPKVQHVIQHPQHQPASPLIPQHIPVAKYPGLHTKVDNSEKHVPQKPVVHVQPRSHIPVKEVDAKVEDNGDGEGSHSHTFYVITHQYSS